MRKSGQALKQSRSLEAETTTVGIEELRGPLKNKNLEKENVCVFQGNRLGSSEGATDNGLLITDGSDQARMSSELSQFLGHLTQEQKEARAESLPGISPRPHQTVKLT